LIFTLSSKTEVGSAGEQPARDILMADENVIKGVAFCNSFDIF
jgi:hypothetical protein